MAFLSDPAANSKDDAVTQVAIGAMLGGYESTRFKAKAKSAWKLESLEVLVEGVNGQAPLAKAEAIVKGNGLTK